MTINNANIDNQITSVNNKISSEFVTLIHNTLKLCIDETTQHLVTDEVELRVDNFVVNQVGNKMVRSLLCIDDFGNKSDLYK